MARLNRARDTTQPLRRQYRGRMLVVFLGLDQHLVKTPSGTVRASAGNLPAGYGELLEQLTNRVCTTQIRAANTELLRLY